MKNRHNKCIYVNALLGMLRKPLRTLLSMVFPLKKGAPVSQIRILWRDVANPIKVKEGERLESSYLGRVNLTNY